MKTSLQNSVSLEDAIKWTKKWRKDHKGPKAFLIPKIDLLEVLSEDGVENIRAYLAYDSDAEGPDTKSDKEKFKHKLLIVGVDKNGKDMIPTAEAAVPNGIYDFTVPCPPTCDGSSPLIEG